MLVIQRKADEGITITADGIRIHINVNAIRDGKVKLGIDAPKHVIVHRDEVQADIDSNNQNEVDRD